MVRLGDRAKQTSTRRELWQSQIDNKAEKLLDLIRRHPGQRFPKEKLAQKLSLDESEIASAVEVLESWGYSIGSGSGWLSFGRAPDSLLSTELSYKLKTKCFGQQLHTYYQVKSTNTVASGLANDGAPEGTLVIAEKQTRGRGRLGKHWHSPAGVGAYLSLILRPKIKASEAPALSLVSAIALAEAIRKVTDLPATLKWPNDVLIKGRKVAGILTELNADQERVNYVIVGMGLNLNNTNDDFPEELRGAATSLRLALRRKVDRIKLIQCFLTLFEGHYRRFCSGGFVRLRQRALKLSALLNQEVTIRGAAQAGKKSANIQGLVVDIDDNGRLLVETSRGRLALICGEVSVAGLQRRSKR